MISLHQLRLYFKKYWILVVPVVVLVLFLAVLLNTPSKGRFDTSQPYDSTVHVSFTPFPTALYVRRTPSPNQTLVFSDTVFESYIIDNSLQKADPSALPRYFRGHPTHVYYTTDLTKPRGILRIQKVSNASYRPLKDIVELELTKINSLTVSYGKYQGYHAAYITFKGADLHSFGETVIVSVPGVFYFFTYAEKTGSRSPEETLQAVHGYLQNFMSGYDWVEVRRNSQEFHTTRFFDARLQDELEYIRSRSSTPSAFEK